MPKLIVQLLILCLLASCEQPLADAQADPGCPRIRHWHAVMTALQTQDASSAKEHLQQLQPQDHIHVQALLTNTRIQEQLDLISSQLIEGHSREARALLDALITEHGDSAQAQQLTRLIKLGSTVEQLRTASSLPPDQEAILLREIQAQLAPELAIDDASSAKLRQWFGQQMQAMVLRQRSEKLQLNRLAMIQTDLGRVCDPARTAGAQACLINGFASCPPPMLAQGPASRLCSSSISRLPPFPATATDRLFQLQQRTISLGSAQFFEELALLEQSIALHPTMRQQLISAWLNRDPWVKSTLIHKRPLLDAGALLEILGRSR